MWGVEEWWRKCKTPTNFFPFTFLLLPWSNATHLSVLITGIGIIDDIVAQPLATLCHEVIFPLRRKAILEALSLYHLKK